MVLTNCWERIFEICIFRPVFGIFVQDFIKFKRKMPKTGRKIQISKIHSQQFVKTIFFYTWAKFGVFSSQIPGEDAFLVIFQKSHLKVLIQASSLKGAGGGLGSGRSTF